MKTFATSTVCMLALIASAMSEDQAAVEYIGVVHEYTDEVHVSLLKGGESGTTLLTIHELECDKPRIEFPGTLASIVREGTFADPDPLMPRLTPRKALVRIQESYYALFPSDDLIYAVRMRHFGGRVYWASGNAPILGAFASFRDEKLYKALSTILVGQSPKKINGEQGAGQSATRSESDSEAGDKPQPESEGCSR